MASGGRNLTKDKNEKGDLKSLKRKAGGGDDQL